MYSAGKITGVLYIKTYYDRHNANATFQRRKIFIANKALRSVRPIFKGAIPRASSADPILR